MPAYRNPRRSGPHRIAAIALFRALLSQCRQLQVQQVQRDELQNLIRNRFKQARHDQSTKRLQVSFEAGYEAIDLLDAAVAGNEESKSHLLKLLGDAPLRARQPPPASPVRTNKRQQADAQTPEDSESATKPKVSLFDRPLPLSQLSGKRHIPVLVSANQIPMLRIKKPQPTHLSAFLSHRMETRQKRHDRRHRLAEELSLAEWEDEWDHIVAGVQTKSKGGGMAMATASEPGWCDAIEDGIEEVHAQLAEEKRKNRVMAEKMQAVVDRETVFFEREKAERQAQKARRLLERKKGSEVQTEGDGLHSRQKDEAPHTEVRSSA